MSTDSVSLINPEREGFEPSIPLEACTRLDEATRAPARQLAAAMTVDEAVTYALTYADTEGVVDLVV